MDSQLIDEKLESLRRCLARVSEKCLDKPAQLAESLDLQDIVALNLTRAVQISVDLAAHTVARRDIPPPNTMGQAFDVLAQLGVIDDELAAKQEKRFGLKISPSKISMLWMGESRMPSVSVTDIETTIYEKLKPDIVANRKNLAPRWCGRLYWQRLARIPCWPEPVRHGIHNTYL